MVQWLRLCTPNVGDLGSIPGQGTGSLILQLRVCWNFPGGLVVKNLPCIAGDSGLSPGWRIKIPHDSEQLSAATTESVL